MKAFYPVATVVGYAAANFLVVLESIQAGNILLWTKPLETMNAMFANRISTIFANPTANDIAILERIVAEKGKDYTIHIFPNADHGLNDFRTGQPVPASQECVDPWLLAHVDVTR